MDDRKPGTLSLAALAGQARADVTRAEQTAVIQLVEGRDPLAVIRELVGEIELDLDVLEQAAPWFDQQVREAAGARRGAAIDVMRRAMHDPAPAAGIWAAVRRSLTSEGARRT